MFAPLCVPLGYYIDYGAPNLVLNACVLYVRLCCYVFPTDTCATSREWIPWFECMALFAYRTAVVWNEVGFTTDSIESTL